MPDKPQRAGGRMLNYFPVPNRYRMSASLDDEGEWGAKLVGVFFVVLGVLTVARPAFSELGRGTALAFGILGIPAMASPASEPWVTLVIGGVLATVGAGIVYRKAWAHWAGMSLAVVLFLPAFPYLTLAGLLILYVLWRGRPKRRRTATKSSD